jgi:hypothetical protein
MQDTFFVSDPPMADKPRADPASEKQMDQMEASSQRLFATEESEKAKKPRDFEKYWNDVKKVHEDGAFGSIGCTYRFHSDDSIFRREAIYTNARYRPLQVQGRGDTTPGPPHTHHCCLHMGTSPIGREPPTCTLLLH